LAVQAANWQHTAQVAFEPENENDCEVECHDAPIHTPKASAVRKVAGRFSFLRMVAIVYTGCWTARVFLR